MFELLAEVRRSHTATDRFDQAVADALGLNRTDMRCLDVIDSEGPLPAGRLASATGLSSAAITTVLDRLEAAGYTRRRSDPADRRRVLVELDPDEPLRTERFYKPQMELSEQIYRRYTREQLALILGFLREGRELNEAEAGRLEQVARGLRPE